MHLLSAAPFLVVMHLQFAIRMRWELRPIHALPYRE